MTDSVVRNMTEEEEEAWVAYAAAGNLFEPKKIDTYRNEVCPVCQCVYPIDEVVYRNRKRKSRSGLIFCSRKCARAGNRNLGTTTPDASHPDVNAANSILT